MKMTTSASRTRRRDIARNRLAAFRRAEDGALIIFGLFIFVLMLMVGGMAVDLMRFETTRAKLQGTSDICVLAAADLSQTLDPAEVVTDCLDKAGMAEFLVGEPVVDQGLNYRVVTTTSRANVPMLFMNLMGIDQLQAPAVSSAEEWVTNIEISLVLDISGSMRFDNRMINLRPAAKSFIHTVLDANEDDTVSINLIPYAGQTNPGPVMFSYLNGVRYPAMALNQSQGGIDERLNHNRINPASPAGTGSNPSVRYAFPNVSSCLELPNTTFANASLPQTGLSQTAHFMFWDIAASVMDWGWCPQDRTAIQYASNNEAALSTYIDNIRMHDGTGTHYAMKWALALLNPASNAAFRYLNTNGGLVPNAYADRPAAWNATDTVKYIVLMTDGQITEQVRPVSNMHVLNPTSELQRRPSNQRTQITSANQNVNSFYALCNQAKANGVVIFTIAFEAPSAARTQMANCASSPSHYFNVTGLEISDAFSAIANQINQLRLTQ